jgi:zinc transporter
MTHNAESLLETQFHPAFHGLICGFAMLSDQQIQHLTADDLDAALARPNAVVWLHFNARVGHARDWITSCEHLTKASRRFLLDTDDRKRLERRGDCLTGVISDIRYDFGLDFDPEQIAALRFHLDRGCLISTRREPCSAADQLRTEINNGRHFDSPAKLMIHLFELQVAKLNETAARVRGMLDDIEDQVLVGQMRGQHVQLGGIRRLAVRLNHHFGPEHRMLQRLCRRPPEWFGEVDNAALQDAAEEFRELVEDLAETQERAKLLQEELAARTAEQTSNNLYILSLFTALLLPPSLIAGIFGMNVVGVPGVQDGNEMAFWWVMLGMAAVSLLVLLILYLRRFK